MTEHSRSRKAPLLRTQVSAGRPATCCAARCLTRVVGGPYTASYDTNCAVVKTEKGDRVVDSVNATATGPVK